MGILVARGGVAKKRGGDRVSTRKASPSWPAPLVRCLARLHKGGGCAACFVARVQYSAEQ